MRILLRLLGRIIRAHPAPVRPAGPLKILIVDLSYIGDLVMASVVHTEVRKNLPGATIHVLGFPAVKSILPLVRAIDLLHAVPKNGVWRQAVIALRLRRENYDLAIHLNTGLWVNFIVWLTGARLRLGYDYRGRGCFHNIRIPIEARTVRTKYRPQECAELLEKGLGWTVTGRVAELNINDGVVRAVEEKLRGWGVTGEDFLVGIHTSSRQDREIRCWEKEKFAAVANHLVARHNAKLIFTDVADDRTAVEPIFERIARKDRIVDAMGGTTIPELCALLRRIDLYLTINTAPMHLAVAMGTPLVAVVGYAPPRIYFPPGDARFQWVMDKALEHYDPQALVQKEPSRVKEISVEEVLEKVEYLIHRVIPRTMGRTDDHGGR